MSVLRVTEFASNDAVTRVYHLARRTLRALPPAAFQSFAIQRFHHCVI